MTLKDDFLREMFFFNAAVFICLYIKLQNLALFKPTWNEQKSWVYMWM